MKFRALPSYGSGFQTVDPTEPPREEGHPNSHSDGSRSNFICFICWCSIQDLVCKKKGGIDWEVTVLYHVPSGGFQPQNKSLLGTHQGKEEEGTSSTGQLPHVLCTTGLLLEKERAESYPVEEVFPGLTSWVLLGQLCGSCLDNSKALSRLSVTNHPSLASYGSLMPGKQCFQAPPRPASSECILIPGVG